MSNIATSHTPNNNPVHSFQVSLSLWNANGLRQSTVHDVLHHVQNTHVLLVTETWLTSGSFPTNWSQFHLYGSKVPGAFNRGSGGITAFVSPSCPFSVSQLPSYNAHTLSLKVGTLTVHCVYLPPPLSSDKVLSLLRSLPVTSDTILCGDFNARFGSLLGDTNANPRVPHYFHGWRSSIGVKSGRPGHWKKYWTQEIEDAARERDTSIVDGGGASRFAKVETWNLYQAAHRRFRSLVQAAKRRSWNQFCSDLEKDFSKATAAIKRIKRNKECSATYSHPDGPTASVNTWRPILPQSMMALC
ncbi:uncharacterized protein ATC70_003749 [Mucor velutinosus]|uniref:Endonuclease/exonuclease/phosphatase domain-containing protein n=1 Tax=Mucor velutinosus TaxID=708070 RepID=A0AAN7HY78_9FUNG|nr:hypothetical protein ATC70_003749 [Mucor velutinosus]